MKRDVGEGLPRELRGIVLDEGGGALAGALVEIDDGGRALDVTTDEGGRYRLGPLTLR